MSVDLGRRLLAIGAVQPAELRHALREALASERPLARALVDVSPGARSLLARPFVVAGGPQTRTVTVDPTLHARLPAGCCHRLLVAPMRRDPLTGIVDLAVVDPLDPHPLAEVAHHLRMPLRPIAAPLSEIERALLLVDDAPPRTRPSGGMPRASGAGSAGGRDAGRVRDLQVDDAEVAVPLLRRLDPSARGGRQPNGEGEPAAGARIRASLAPPTTLPFEGRADSAPPAGARASDPPIDLFEDGEPSVAGPDPRDRAATARTSGPASERALSVPLKRPPFPSLTAVLEAIDAALGRDDLIAAILRGLTTTAAGAAVFAPRRGHLVGIGATGLIDGARIRGRELPIAGAIAEAITRGERLGKLDRDGDRSLVEALDVARYERPHVLLQRVVLRERTAMLFVSLGIGDALEAARRAKVLSTAASSALARLLRR
jgi:hypothetical protein